jgi:HlyD family secretion protein
MRIKSLIVPALALGCLVYATNSIVRTQPVRELTQPPIPPPQSAYQSAVAAVGLIEPSTEIITLGSARAGIVDQVLVQVGAEVKTGQPLIKLRTTELQAEHTVAQAAIAETQAQLKVAEAQVKIAESQVQVVEAELAQAKRLLSFADNVKDSRVLSDEERSQRAMTVTTAEARRDATKASVTAALADVESARSRFTSAKAKLAVVDTEIQRCTVQSPIDATVLQVRIRPGEALTLGPGSGAWITIGQLNPLHLRTDIDEHEAWRVKATSPAIAQVRGNPKQQVQLEFVRFEPLIIPKRSLTGDAIERVDTRVLQVIYRMKSTPQLRLFPGQQMDIFIQAEK